MGDVGDALLQYATVVDEKGFEYFTQMNPGRDRADVEATLGSVGVPAHDDVVDWYSFHDGVRPGSGSRTVELYGFVGVCGLDEAVAHRAKRLSGYLAAIGLPDDEISEIRAAGLEMPYEPGWMPIAVGQETCVIDTAVPERPGRFLALWDNEHEPRQKAPSLSHWIRQLTDVARSGGLSWRSPADSVTVERLTFDHGTLIHEELGVLASETLVRNLAEYRSPKVVLLHRPVGEVDGNDGLERRQAEEAARYLRTVLDIELHIEFREGEAPVGHKVFVDIRAGLPDA